MSDYAVAPAPLPSIALHGSARRFPVRRIWCVARNYEAHRREVGMTAPDPPFFFQKPPDAVVANGAAIPYPPRCANFHHEIELVAAIGRAGRDIPAAHALGHVFGYAVGNDLTRRDVQQAAREKGYPWDMGKGFDHSAAITAIHPAEGGHWSRGRIWLTVNGEMRQQADLADMIWGVPEIIAELSTWVALEPGDLVYTGTPAGVGPLARGDRVEGGIDGLDVLVNTIL